MQSFYARLTAYLIGTICACGGVKDSQRAFCFDCYRPLTVEEKRGLSRKLGDKYASNFETCIETLKGLGRVENGYKP